MSSTMSFRDLYLVAGTSFDRAAARAVVVRLCNEASPAELGQIDEGGWLADDDPEEFNQLDEDGGLNDTAAADLSGGSEEQVAALRRRATESLGLAVDRLESSLHGRGVARFRFDKGDDPGVDAYVTGGVTNSDGPTDAYEAWALVFDTWRLPDGWPDKIGAAAGIIHPSGSGPVICAVTFRAWGDA